jgi:hypothetical protein
MATAVASPPDTGSVGSDTSPQMVAKEQDMSKTSDRIPTPPTSEDMNKHEDHSSDLSELEDDDDDDADGELEDVKPDHYWDEENGGKVPVFKPVCHVLGVVEVAPRTQPCRMPLGGQLRARATYMNINANE